MSADTWWGIGIGVAVSGFLILAAALWALASISKVDIGDEDDRWRGL
jgi:hypothetical protein